jgi:hypothetical protein
MYFGDKIYVLFSSTTSVQVVFLCDKCLVLCLGYAYNTQVFMCNGR